MFHGWRNLLDILCIIVYEAQCYLSCSVVVPYQNLTLAIICMVLLSSLAQLQNLDSCPSVSVCKWHPVQKHLPLSSSCSLAFYLPCQCYRFKFILSMQSAAYAAAILLEKCYSYSDVVTYRVRIKKCPRRKLQFLQNYSIFQYEIFYSCLWVLAALRLILSWNFINLHRNGNTWEWDTKFDFCKSPEIISIFS